ncbi:hypothetical protein FRB90_001990 [Tulasnella sp. 427]|nr:hypothetical protein FRB90_001990 [Tulasnella sp. 427]
MTNHSPATLEIEQGLETAATSLSGHQSHLITIGTASEKDSEQPKLSARDVLIMLQEKRLTVAEVTFPVITSGNLRGGHADVQIGTLLRNSKSGNQGGPTTVAVKKIRCDPNGIAENAGERLLRLFVNELRILSKLEHSNIVKIIGFVEDSTTATTWLIFPWEENGNLRAFLQAAAWDIPERIQEVAHGLEYLHTRDPPICHCDLKSLNVLVTSRHSAVITDFGSARMLRVPSSEPGTSMDTYTSISGAWTNDVQGSPITIETSDTDLTLTGPAYSIRWAPPEVVVDARPPSLTNDIWALGWIAWEAITGLYPFEDLQSKGRITFTIAQGQLPQLREHGQLSQIESLCELMLRCWRRSPETRPSAKECKADLETMARCKTGGATSKDRSATLLLQNGEVLHAAGRNAEALEAFDRALTICLESGDATLEASALSGQAKVHRAMFDHVQAEACYIQLREACSSINDRLGEARALKDLGDVRLALLKYDEAEGAYRRALGIYTKRQHVLGAATVLKCLGDLQLTQRRYTQAVYLYSALRKHRNTIGDASIEAGALKGLGDIHRTLRKYTQAEESYSRALDLYTKANNISGEASVLEGLGDLLLRMHKYTEAQTFYAQALEIYSTLEDPLGEANALRGLGSSYAGRDDLDTMMELFGQALEKYEKAKPGYLHSRGISHKYTRIRLDTKLHDLISGEGL